MRFVFEDVNLSSIRQINALPEHIKLPIYRSLVPRSILSAHPVQGLDLGQQIEIQVRCPDSSCLVEIGARHPIDRRDPVIYVELADTATGQIQVLLMVVNDPTAPRFDTDRDWRGESTKLGTMARNVPAEVQAIQAGLAPGQVRRGLGLSRDLIPIMEQFTAGLGKDRFFIEPLTYHNAIMFERYGFAYVTGHTRMIEIHEGFGPGGCLRARLDGSNPFRQPDAHATVRGRSWAIHDGILGETWSGIRMYKRVHQCARLCTFPNGAY